MDMPEHDDPIEATMREQLTATGPLLHSDPSAALVLVQAVMDSAEVRGYSCVHALALRTRGMCHGAMGNMQEAGRDFQACLEQARAFKNPCLEALCLHGLGNVCFYRGEFAQALEYMHCSLAIHRELGDEFNVMVGHNSLGAAFTQLADYPNAVVHFTDSLQIARRSGDKMNEALALCNIGYARMEFGEFEEAIERMTESVRLVNDVRATIYKPVIIGNLAMAHYRSGQLEEALSRAEEAITACHEIGNSQFEVTSLYVLAMVQKERDETEIAEACLLRALELTITNCANLKIVEITCALGRLYLGRSDFVRARHYLEAGLEHAQKGQQKLHVSELHLALSELFEAMGDTAGALAVHRAYHAIYRAELKESAQNRLTAQLAQLEVERVQQQAEIQRLRNVELAEANQRNVELLERLQQHANQLSALTITDPLTGMYNRRYLQDYLQNEFENIRHTSRLSLAIVDLDNFKKINDRFSHHIGDEVLKATAQLIQNAIRPSDIAVRFGGEEFVIALADLLRPDALEICERVRLAIASYPWSHIHSDLAVTTSIGVADTREDPIGHTHLASPAERVLALADERLYRAKEYGKNRVV